MGNSATFQLPHDARFLNLDEPNLARIFNYFAGGVTNFEVDRAAAHKLLEHFPFMRTIVRLGKAFSQEAAKQLYLEGFEQFLDLGSGIPAEIGIHTFAPTAHVVYTDINPVAVGYGSSLYTNLQHVTYLHCDAREIDAVCSKQPLLDALNWESKMAVGLNFLPLLFTPEEVAYLFETLDQILPKQSKIFQFICARTVNDVSEAYISFQQLLRPFNFSIHLHTVDQLLKIMKPWKPVQIEPVINYLGLTSNLHDMGLSEQLGLTCSAIFFERA